MTGPALFVLLVSGMVLPATPAVAGSCNPLVGLEMTDVSLARTLDMLSVEYGFELTFPQDIDRAVSISARLPLNRLVEKLTKGTNTLLAYREVDGCVQPELARVVVYPEGGQADAGSPDSQAEMPPVSAAPAPREYIYIENMEQYVEEVLLRKRRPDLEHMTPEQQAEFRHVKRKLKKILEPQLKDGTLKREQRRQPADAAAVETTAASDQ